MFKLFLQHFGVKKIIKYLLRFANYYSERNQFVKNVFRKQRLKLDELFIEYLILN